MQFTIKVRVALSYVEFGDCNLKPHSYWDCLSYRRENNHTRKLNHNIYQRICDRFMHHLFCRAFMRVRVFLGALTADLRTAENGINGRKYESIVVFIQGSFYHVLSAVMCSWAMLCYGGKVEIVCH